MRNSFTRMVVCILLTLTFAACSKTSLKEIPATNTPVSAANPGTQAQTAQSIMSELEFSPEYTLNGLYARMHLTFGAESFILNKQYPVNGKYSFSLLDSKGKSRISNLQYSFDGGPWTPLPYTITEGCKYPDIVLNTLYFSYYSTGTATSYLKNGKIGTILAADDSPNNNGACGNADIAKASLFLPARLEVPLFLKIKGVFKGNEYFIEEAFVFDFAL